MTVEFDGLVWTLPQVLTWIIWRDKTKVVETRKERISCMEVLDRAIKTDRAKIAFQCRDELFEKLQNGDVVAYGIKSGDFSASPITIIAWDEIETLHIFNEDIPANDVGRMVVGSVHFEYRVTNEVLFKSVFINQRDVLAEWPKFGERKTGGRPPAVDWTLVQQEAHRLMEHNGDFDPTDPEWNVQAKLEKRLLEYCSNTFGKEPGNSTLRTKIPPWLDHWRLGRIGSGQKSSF